MLVPRPIACLIFFGMMLFGTGAVFGQNYPVRTIRIVTSEPGGSTDFLARLIAQGISSRLGKQVIVDNRGGGMLAAEFVSRAPPDGYTLLLSGTSLWLSPFMRDTLYDPLKSFSPITLAGNSPNVLVTHPSLPVRSLKELIALAKARPGELNYGSGSTGSPSHLAAELFKAMAGVNIVRIPYKGTGPAVNALVGGQVQLMFVSPTSVAPHVKAGRLRGLAVTAAQPSALAPGLPTVSGAGLTGYESTSSFGVLAPAYTPAAIINWLNQEIVQVLTGAEAKERLFSAGVEPVGNSADAFAALIKSDMAKWGKLIKAAGIRDE
ncbi:MAG TPA: tripartite tricarboxylate transporter substrate binding protein [Burkholderiales bacterium]|jgi:tripartite-type tricarboxylate transporter receptor subunit TctC|nr:tripartite tricarboxylate transporter substrate binding protein [Burkholderiales bacterium]